MRVRPWFGMTLLLLLAAGCQEADDSTDGPNGASAAEVRTDGDGAATSAEDAPIDDDGAQTAVTDDGSAGASAPRDEPMNSASDGAAEDESGGYVWDLPEHFPVPKVPEDNPMSEAKVELGRYLFYDKRLSENETQSCGTCHLQKLAFTDGRAVGLGSTGESHIRGAMSLANVAYTTTMTWANPAVVTLERQALVPLLGEDPVELGMRSMEALEARFKDDPMYQEMFAEAYPEEEDPITTTNLVKAIAAFERSLISGNSPFDRYQAGDSDALSDSAKRGLALFNSEQMECFHCHGGHYFSDSETHQGKVFDEVSFHNNGLYNIAGTGEYPAGNGGLYEATGEATDMGRFKTPTLRNIAVTGPYMHDGSIATLEEVLDHYAAGGRTLQEGEYAGIGRDNPYKSAFVPGFELSDSAKRHLVAFLESLTDQAFLTDPRFADPWEEGVDE